MITTWPAPAKLNLFLYITGRRPDGYHNLQTLFQFLDYGDTLHIKPNQSGSVTLMTPMVGIPNTKNLIIRAAEMLKTAAYCKGTLPVGSGAQITVDKRLPIGSGLGGGSSNAATVLVALNHLWQTGFSLNELAYFGVKLGADIPVFIKGFAAFAEGVGEKLLPAYPIEQWYLVAYPGVSINTTQIFNDPQLIRDTSVRTLTTLWQLPYSNDCETVVRKRFHKVDELVSWLLKYAPARLTGTGACVFAELNTEQAARQILKHAPRWIHGFVAKGMNVSPLQLALKGNQYHMA